MVNIGQSFGGMPVYFIRFNPDDYTKNNIKVSSCWGINGNGICVIKKNKQIEWNDRLVKLKEKVEFWINPENISNKTKNIKPHNMNLIKTSTRLCTIISVIPSTMFAITPINNRITIKNKTIFLF
jgi:hypothetical protein